MSDSHKPWCGDVSIGRPVDECTCDIPVDSSVPDKPHEFHSYLGDVLARDPDAIRRVLDKLPPQELLLTPPQEFRFAPDRIEFHQKYPRSPFTMDSDDNITACAETTPRSDIREVPPSDPPLPSG